MLWKTYMYMFIRGLCVLLNVICLIYLEIELHFKKHMYISVLCVICRLKFDLT